MREIRQRRVFVKRIYSPVVLVILTCIFAFGVRGVYRVYIKERDSGERSRQAAEELNRITIRKAELEAEIRHLQTPEGVESEIRENFRMARPGENLAIILGAEEPMPTTTSQGLVDKVKSGVKKVLGR